MKISVTLQYHPPTGECAYFPATDSVKMLWFLNHDETLFKLLRKVSKRIDELAKSQLVFDFKAPSTESKTGNLFASE